MVNAREIRFRRVKAQNRSGIGGGIIPRPVPARVTDILPASNPKSATDMTQEEQLEQSRLDNPDGYLPDNMRQVQDLTTVRGLDAYNAAQTAADVVDHIAGTLTRMLRAASTAEKHGDFTRADRIDSMLRAAASERGKGALEFQGLKLYIENPKGSWREKTGKDGKKWRRKMAADYGRINKTKGADGDNVDVFVGPKDDSRKAYVVDQVREDGTFDEHKTVLGCGSKSEAKALYLANYPKGWEIGDITEFDMPAFRKWLDGGDMKKPAAKKK